MTSWTTPLSGRLGNASNGDDRRLAHMDQGDLRLVDLGLHAHVLRVGQIEDRLVLPEGHTLIDHDRRLPRPRSA